MAYTTSNMMKRILPYVGTKVKIAETSATASTKKPADAAITRCLIEQIVPHVRPPVVKSVFPKELPKNQGIVMNRAKRGLYAGCHIRFGDNVSEDGGNRTRRTWKPNVQNKRLFSVILNRFIRFRATTDAINAVDRAGGIDEYLLKTPIRRIDSKVAMHWKEKIEKKYIKLSERRIPRFLLQKGKKSIKETQNLKV